VLALFEVEMNLLNKFVIPLRLLEPPEFIFAREPEFMAELAMLLGELA